MGERGGARFRLGDQVRVRLVEANSLTGGLIFALATMPAAAKPRRNVKRKTKANTKGKAKGRRRKK